MQPHAVLAIYWDSESNLEIHFFERMTFEFNSFYIITHKSVLPMNQIINNSEKMIQ